MTILIWAAGAFCILATAIHLASALAAIIRCRAPVAHLPASHPAPPVSLVRPICGIENYVEETLASAFALDYPRYEIVFCVASAQDPVVPIVRRLMAAHPHVPALLLVEITYAPPVWLQLAIWLPITLFSALALLQPTKGAIVGLQWQTCMHDFEVTRRMRTCVEAVNHGEEMDLRHRNPSPLRG